MNQMPTRGASGNGSATERARSGADCVAPHPNVSVLFDRFKLRAVVLEGRD